MAKKDTYLALLRRGIDETTAMQLADAGLKIGDLKKIDKTKLIENYGLKPDIAEGVVEIISAGPQTHGKERYLSKVLAPERKKVSKIEELKFQRQQKDILADLAEQKERLKLAKIESFRAKKLVMNRLGKTIELIVKLENNLYDEGKDDQKVKIRDQSIHNLKLVAGPDENVRPACTGGHSPHTIRPGFQRSQRSGTDSNHPAARRFRFIDLLRNRF